MKQILVWDWPVRVGHWLMVGGFCLAWLTAESEHLLSLHVVAGAVVIGAACFRLAWGFVGSRYACFDNFIHGPQRVWRYLDSVLAMRAQHHAGHNPAGGWAIMLMLGLAIASGLAGWMLHNDLGGHWLEELHEGLAAIMLAVVLLHLAGVFAGSLVHGENLVAAMLTGRKRGLPGEAIASARPLAAVVLLAWVALAAWWLAN